MSTYKFKLAICIRFNPILHGIDSNSSPDILNHHLIIYTFDLEEFYNNEYKEIIELINTNATPNTIMLDIIKCDELIGLEQVGYIKTFWLKIVQRRWKKIYKERQEILKCRSSLLSLKIRELTGQWPNHLRHWPKFTLNLTC